MAAKELSGPKWVSRFPDAKTTSSLDPKFREGCEKFIDAMRHAGMTVTVSSTRRPDERAWLMYYSWRAHRKILNPQNVPSHPNIAIEWVHRDASGKVDLTASRKAASAMVAGYDIAYPPAYPSLHMLGQAIDMSVSWSGSVLIVDANGKKRVVKAPPANGFNLALRRVGRTYGVIKNPRDRPHWSTTGR